MKKLVPALLLAVAVVATAATAEATGSWNQAYSLAVLCAGLIGALVEDGVEREQREQPHERHHQREPLAQHPIGAGLLEGGAPRLERAPLHEPASDQEEGHPQKETPARDPHGRPVPQPGVWV